MSFIVRRGAHINGLLITEGWLNGMRIPLMQWLLFHTGEIDLPALTEAVIAALPPTVLFSAGELAVISLESMQALAALPSDVMSHAGEISGPICEGELLAALSGVLSHILELRVTTTARAELADPWTAIAQHVNTVTVIIDTETASMSYAVVVDPEHDGDISLTIGTDDANLTTADVLALLHGGNIIGAFATSAALADVVPTPMTHDGEASVETQSNAAVAALPPLRMESYGEGFTASGTQTLGLWELPYEDDEGYLVIPQSYAVTVDGEYIFIQ